MNQSTSNVLLTMAQRAEPENFGPDQGTHHENEFG